MLITGCSSGIDVITIQPGAVASSFADTAARNLERFCQEGSLYRELALHIESRARLSKQGSTSADAFAAAVADQILAARPKAVIRLGRGSRLLPLIGRLPRRIRERILARRFGLAKLAR